jgi:tetratricopeptide (TPR) repeat protein
MVKRVLYSLCLLTIGMFFIMGPAMAYDFGDHRSVTLATKAWKALADKDVDAVVAYTNKCVELYGEKAKEMQKSLKDYVAGSNDAIFAYWALNDVATCLFIQGEALREADKKEEAKKVYQRVVDEFQYGQCWDTGGWFWKPAEASKAKIAMIESGSTVDFGDYKSTTLATKAWEALGKNDLESVEVYTNKCLELYAEEAKKMQAALTEYPWESKEQIFSYWALNDVGTCLFIKGEAYKNAGKTAEATKALQQLVDEYFYAQCWDPQGWFWKPAEAAKQKLDELAATAKS